MKDYVILFVENFKSGFEFITASSPEDALVGFCEKWYTNFLNTFKDFSQMAHSNLKDTVAMFNNIVKDCEITHIFVINDDNCFCRDESYE